MWRILLLLAFAAWIVYLIAKFFNRNTHDDKNSDEFNDQQDSSKN